MTKQTDIVLRLTDLTKNFGNFTAVDRVNLEIHRGEIMGFLGPNGAGKSTTMKMIARLLKPSSGTVEIRDDGALIPLTNRTKDYLLEGAGFLIENPTFYENLSPRKILRYFAKLKGYPRGRINARVKEVVNLVKMGDWIDKPVKTFSKGMRQKIGIVSAIVHEPDIVVLDEPQTGLDPKARKEVRDFIRYLKDESCTVFLSSHILYDISEVADRVAIISRGKLIACDTVDNLELQARQSIIRVEILQEPDAKTVGAIIKKLVPVLTPLTGLEDPEFTIRYNWKQNAFEIMFDGTPRVQYLILRKLLDQGVQVTEFSVPKANLLEELYVRLIDEAEGISGIPGAHPEAIPGAVSSARPDPLTGTSPGGGM